MTVREGVSPTGAAETEAQDIIKNSKARSLVKRSSGSAAKQVAYHRIARAGGWGLLVGALAGIVAACVPTLLTPWQLVAIGTSLGTSLDYLGLMPSRYRRNLVTKWAKHYDQLVRDDLISDAQRQRQIEVLLLKHGP
jgi:hypothetical protein